MTVARATAVPSFEIRETPWTVEIGVIAKLAIVAGIRDR